MQELERVKTYIRKLNSAEQVPTDRTLAAQTSLLTLGNLVIDRAATQRMILHSIPRNQIVADPNAQENPSRGEMGQKRRAHETSDSQSMEEAKLLPSKKRKLRQRKLTFWTEVTKAEATNEAKFPKNGNKAALIAERVNKPVKTTLTDRQTFSPATDEQQIATNEGDNASFVLENSKNVRKKGVKKGGDERKRKKKKSKN
jgi:hypothetical protein